MIERKINQYHLLHFHQQVIERFALLENVLIDDIVSDVYLIIENEKNEKFVFFSYKDLLVLSNVYMENDEYHVLLHQDHKYVMLTGNILRIYNV
jgi:hypothetical protein